MKGLIDGKWHDDVADTPELRERSAQVRQRFFRGRVGAPEFPADRGRYTLIVSYACPFAHRVILGRALTGLGSAIDLAVVSPVWRRGGWAFVVGDRSLPPSLERYRLLHQLYTLTQSDYTGRVTVPVLWDRERGAIVNNESAEILRMMSEAFAPLGTKELDLYPRLQRDAIDDLCAWMEPELCDGVYVAGFASTQAAYERAVRRVFAALDRLDARLANSPYLFGDSPTEADVKLFTTLIRFDVVYGTAFKCTLRRVADMPRLWAFVHRFASLRGVADTIRFDHIRHHYFDDFAEYDHTIVPLLPEHVAGFSNLSKPGD